MTDSSIEEFKQAYREEILAENLDKAITWLELTYVDAVVEQ